MSICQTYFIQPVDGGLIKIGKSCDVKRRLSEMQGGSPVRLGIIGIINADVEAHLHNQFSDLRVRREWFTPHESLVKFIEQECSSEKISEKKFCEMEDVENVLKRKFDHRYKADRLWFFDLISEWAGLGDYGDCEEHDECDCDICCSRRGIDLLLKAGVSEIAICKRVPGEMPRILCSMTSGINRDKSRLLVDAWWEFDYAEIDLHAYYYEVNDLTNANLQKAALSRDFV